MADICIVGAGTSGLTLASEFINAPVRVILIESGGLKPDKDNSELSWGENIGLKYYPLDTARARYFGGSTNRWHVSIGQKQLGARIRPLDAIDFEERDYLPNSGWPFSKNELEPYYIRAQEVCRTVPSSYAVEDWFSKNRFQKLPFDSERVQTIVFKFCAKENFFKDHGEAVKHSNNIHVLLFANLTQIETDETAKNVRSLNVASLNGTRFRVSAKLFVLAAGGIEVPRLLLSSNQTMSCGIGNQNDLVGRFFMEHLHFWSGLFVPADNSLINRTMMYNEIKRIEGVPVIAKLALSESLMRQERLINHNVQLIPRVVLRSSLYPYVLKNFNSDAVDSFKILLSAARKGRIAPEAGRHLRVVMRGYRQIARKAARRGIIEAARLFDRRRTSMYIFANMTEQIPNPESRVTLGADRDSLEVPRVRLNWQVTQQDIVNAIRVQEIIGREIERTGIGRLFIQLAPNLIPPDLHGGYHHMGTTRMNRDPKRGVVDPDGRVHGLSNLFIAGPSVFPTGGHANPVLTIIALTLRLAGHIRKIFLG